MRGKLPCVTENIFSRGLIPAYAGKTADFALAIVDCGAHPRVCGENREIAFGNWYEQGSSPRMRGKPARSTVDRSAAGLIPAYAGKTE